MLQAKYLDLNMYYKSMEQQDQVPGFKADNDFQVF